VGFVGFVVLLLVIVEQLLAPHGRTPWACAAGRRAARSAAQVHLRNQALVGQPQGEDDCYVRLNEAINASISNDAQHTFASSLPLFFHAALITLKFFACTCSTAGMKSLSLDTRMATS